MSPLSHKNQSSDGPGQSPLSVVDRGCSHVLSSSGGSIGGIPVDGSFGPKVVVSGILVVVSSDPSPGRSPSPEPSSGGSNGGIPVGLTVEGSSDVTGSSTSGRLVVLSSVLK